MTFEDVWNFLCLAGFVALTVLSIRWSRKKKQMFLDAAQRVGIEHFAQTDGNMHGIVRGLRLDVRFVAPRNKRPAYTAIEVACAPCAVMLHLRRQDAAEERDVQEGRAVDVTVGDPDFDAAWIVEGAPTERVKRVLSNPSLRAGLVAFSRMAGASVDIEDGKLTLYRTGTDVGADAVATERIVLAVQLAEAVVADAETPLASGEPSAAGAGYRTAARVDGDAAGAAQMEALKTLRAVRTMHDLRIPAMAFSSIVTALMLGVSAAGVLVGPVAVALLVFAALATAPLAYLLQSARRGAPSVKLDPVTVWWMVGCWAINLALTVAAFAGGGGATAAHSGAASALGKAAAAPVMAPAASSGGRDVPAARRVPAAH